MDESSLVNAQTEAMFGYARDELLGRRLDLLVPSASAPRTPATGTATSPIRARVRWARGSSSSDAARTAAEFPAEISLSSIETDDGLLAIAGDARRLRARRGRAGASGAAGASSRRRAERRTRTRAGALEAQLNQLRRLESVGQLAGGIAHDFNNILGVILNYAQFVAEEPAARARPRATTSTRSSGPPSAPRR